MISQKSKQTDRFALKGLFLSTKHNATANFLQKIIKWKRHFWADALSFTKYQNLQGAHSYPKWEYNIKNVSVNWSMILRLEWSLEFKMLCWKILGLALSELTIQNSPNMP